ncbi:hypothetical protein F0562_014976 [Nyssa sinensis]|uniref:Retrotransposon gag domain-containing protein n=1 Tax=Nyssa sinensis TaxID=561372 RepID=A0A5J4ZTN5_9ASTE|nr:hypothetical protein F0562_014976 [Nyssa sinensis]
MSSATTQPQSGIIAHSPTHSLAHYCSVTDRSLDDTAASLHNAAICNERLAKHITGKPIKGTPLRPEIPIPTYIFSLFDEDQKIGAPEEKHWGLLYANGTKKCLRLDELASSFILLSWNSGSSFSPLNKPAAMATNKERIEILEAGLGGLQEGMDRMELGVADKFHHLEETTNRLSEALFSNKEGSSRHTHPNDRDGHSRNNQEDNRDELDGGRSIFSSKMAKLEFPRYSGDDPTEWFNRVAQFFEYQGTTDAQKVPLASFHLEGEANQWWQWLRRTFKEEGRVLNWEIFEAELWARFGPSDCEDFDKALSRIRQVGSLRDYQEEFERLGNRVCGWTQKALIGTFMGGLKTEISDAIRMFKPQMLKEAISLARMKDDQLSQQCKFLRPSPSARAPLALPPPA